MTKKEEFTKWFDAIGLKWFKAHELTNYFERDKNTYPPKSKWDNIIPSLILLDELREEIGVSIRITSSYRSAAYNKSVGGAPKSYHKEFKALDFQSSYISPTRLYHFMLRKRNAGKFKGGLAEYSTFVHIDTRGKNADW